MDNLEKYFLKCRDSVYKKDAKQFLLSKIAGSEQESDLTVPSNCNGYGRIRHFRRCVDECWVTDPLPIDPACKALGIPYVNMLETQVFQIAVCNVHCWYCFVPDELKCSELALSRWFTAEQMVKTYSAIADDVRVLKPSLFVRKSPSYFVQLPG